MTPTDISSARRSGNTACKVRFTVEVDPSIPQGEIPFKDAKGATVGKIVNIGPSDSA